MEDYLNLTNEEKSSLVKSQIKNIQFTKYNIELNILAESAIEIPDESAIARYQIQLQDLVDKEQALQNELLKLV